MAFKSADATNGGTIAWDVITDLVCIADLVIRFFSSYTDSLGNEIKVGPLIAYRYMFTRQFIFDLMNLLLANTLITYFVPSLKVFRLAKLIVMSDYINIRASNLDITTKQVL